MILGYLAMHLTFISLFASMRRLGSHFWLAFTVMLTGLFAFLFALVVTVKIGVPISMVLLSEGLPFLVVTVGFEKPIMLTKAVLSASLDKKRRGSSRPGEPDSVSKLPSIKDAVQIAVKENGWIIVRDYAIEIAILVWGVASGVQGGLRQFCFLAAWTLFFDCILLFTFYTAILTVKLEINRIKRHVEERKALEDDGVSRRVAENVAKSNDLANRGSKPASDSDPDILFGESGQREIPKFKIYTVGGFALLNVINLLTIPFRQSDHPSIIIGKCFSILASLVSQPDIDPFKVAGSGLTSVLSAATRNHKSILVTVLNPIKYELEYPSVHYGPRPNTISHAIAEDAGHMLHGMGGKAIEGVLKSFEDPTLSKWIIIALIFSLSLNGYLFNAARWTIKELIEPDEPAKEAEVLDNPISPQRIPGELTPFERARSVVSENSDGEASPREGNLQELRRIQTEPQTTKRTMEECEAMHAAKRTRELDDEELIELCIKGKLPGYALEKTLVDMTRAVKIRRAVVSRTHATRDTSRFLERSKLPYQYFNYDLVHGACCENVIGYMPLPLGVAGPLNIDGQNYFIPMATTEGVLVASASRGCKAINAGGGAVTVLTGDGMTRGPCVAFESLARAGEAKLWLDSPEGQKIMKGAFDSTSRFARLQTMRTALAGTYLYIRFKTTTGDAMGMNMISKGVEHALGVMKTEAGFDDMAIISVSGNFCTDKKPAAINWIDGRGKSVVAEAVIPGHVVRSILKSDVNALVELNMAKNLIGSAMAGSIGGFNAHAANIVAAVFLATGQDPAQVVESANCITVMKKWVITSLLSQN
jgi:hydroxymethylglutaryl-CoA reductase (NADPH)